MIIEKKKKLCTGISFTNFLFFLKKKIQKNDTKYYNYIVENIRISD